MRNDRLFQSFSRVAFLFWVVAAAHSHWTLALADDASEIDDIYRSEIKAANDRILEIDLALQLRDADIAKLRNKIRDIYEGAQDKEKTPGWKPTRTETHEMSQATARFSELVTEQNAAIARKAGLERKRNVYERLRKKGIVTSKQIKERRAEVTRDQAEATLAMQEAQKRHQEIVTENPIDWSTPEKSQETSQELTRKLQVVMSELEEYVAKILDLGEESMILFGLSMYEYVNSFAASTSMALDPNAIVEQMDKNYGYRPPDSGCNLNCYGSGMYGGFGGEGGYGFGYPRSVPSGIPSSTAGQGSTGESDNTGENGDDKGAGGNF